LTEFVAKSVTSFVDLAMIVTLLLYELENTQNKKLIGSYSISGKVRRAKIKHKNKQDNISANNWQPN
jgi:hypothetical protein